MMSNMDGRVKNCMKKAEVYKMRSSNPEIRKVQTFWVSTHHLATSADQNSAIAMGGFRVNDFVRYAQNPNANI